MKSRRVSTGAPRSGAEIIALRILEAAELDPNKDIKRERFGVAEAASALIQSSHPKRNVSRNDRPGGDCGSGHDPDLLICHEQLGKKMAYEIAKCIIERREELKLVHKEAAKISLESAVPASPYGVPPSFLDFRLEPF